MHLAILEKSTSLLNKPVLERVMIGRRLLSTSREALKRIFYLSYSFRMTGDEKFLKKLLPYLREKALLTEIPRAQRFAGRPSLGSLLPRGGSRSIRDRAIAKAYLRHGYSQQEIAGHVGLHYSTVSRIVKREREKSRNSA